MAIIKQLKTFLSKTKIYPKTLTKAVYNDDGTSLHEVVKNALYADDDGEIVDADPRDADTLGGKYTADFLDQTFQMAQQFMNNIDIYGLHWGAVTDENIGGVDYKVMWPIAPDGTNDVYGLLIMTNGQLGLIRNNKGSKSTSITNYNANTIAGWVTGSSTTQTKSVSYSNYTERAGTVILLNWYNANTYKGLVKMNVNSQGAKDLYLNGQITSATNYDIPKGVYVTYFDGTNYYMRTDGKLPIPQIETMEENIATLTDKLNVKIDDKGNIQSGDYESDLPSFAHFCKVDIMLSHVQGLYGKYVELYIRKYNGYFTVVETASKEGATTYNNFTYSFDDARKKIIVKATVGTSLSHILTFNYSFK